MVHYLCSISHEKLVNVKCGTIQLAAVWVVRNDYLENTCADWSKTGQEPRGEWRVRIQGADVGCLRHHSTERTLLPNIKCINKQRHELERSPHGFFLFYAQNIVASVMLDNVHVYISKCENSHKTCQY